MPRRTESAEQSTRAAATSLRADEELPFRPITARALVLWGLGAATTFHVAYEICPPVIVLFLACAYRLAHTRTRPHAMYVGWVVGLLLYGPQLGFFWNIFGAAALALWMVLATWLSFFLVLQRFALLKLGPRFGALAAPFIWTGLEYFRSELYYLRFSWLNVGYALSPFPNSALVPWLGMYGIGFLLMLIAAQCPFRRSASRKQMWSWAMALLLLIAFAAGLGSLNPAAGRSAPARLHIAGVQLEFPDDSTVVAELDKLLATAPESELFVLSEYSFSGPVPAKVKNWCARNHKYLIAGGKDFTDRTEAQFRNTAFVIGPNGDQIFSQVKAVPIQFFKDGLPAAEQKLWDSPWGKIGLCICYDLSYTRVTDELVRQGAQAIIAPTMDVEEWGERQHRLHARVAPIRAAEYSLPIFRLCSSGISQAVSATGAVLETAPFPGQRQPLIATIDLARRGTRPLDRFLAWPCVAVCAALLLWHVIHSFRPKRRA